MKGHNKYLKNFIYDVGKEGEKTWPKSEIPLSS